MSSTYNHLASVADRFVQVRQRITNAAKIANRDPASITLLAVSKKHSAAKIREAIAQNQFAFGENYLQDAISKIQTLSDATLEWHFIGAVQSNKTAQISQLFAWVHSVDRLKIAQRLSEQRPTDMPPLNVCIQVNLNNETNKAGVAPEQVAELALAMQNLTGIRLRGLMAIPKATHDPQQQQQQFRQLRILSEQLQSQHNLEWDTLSMGMSQDLEAAIAEGSTMVRIGTALFGTRQ